MSLDVSHSFLPSKRLSSSNRGGTRLISFHRHRPSRVLSTRDAAKKEPEVHVLRPPSDSPLYPPLLSYAIPYREFEDA